MNRKLMAVAVAGAFSAPGLAAAQGFTSATPTQIAQPAGVASNAGITLYGRLDETIMANQYKNGFNTGAAAANGVASGGSVADVKKSDLFAPGNAMGIRGREDLGGGTAAWFQLEIGVWPDGRIDGATTTGNNWGGRNSGIGFSSSIGDILLGIWDTPYKVTYGVWNSVTSGGFSAAGILMGNGDSTGALNGVLSTGGSCTGVVNNATGAIGTSGNVCVTETTSNGTAFSRRINNSVQYWTPVMSGFQVKLMTALANYQQPGSAVVPGNSLAKPKEYSANATWARGPLSLGVGYDFHQGLRTTTVAGAEQNAKDTGIQVGAKWNFGPGEIAAGYEQLEYKDNGTAAAPAGAMKVPSWVVNGRWNIGPGAVWASYSASDAKSCSATNTAIGSAVCGVKPKMATIGYDYVLSKRTKMYVAYNKIDNDVIRNAAGTVTAGSSYYYIAGPAANTGTAGGLAPGSDVTTVGLGVQHLF